MVCYVLSSIHRYNKPSTVFYCIKTYYSTSNATDKLADLIYKRLHCSDILCIDVIDFLIKLNLESHRCVTKIHAGCARTSPVSDAKFPAAAIDDVS